MAGKTRYTVRYRRRREGKTNFKNRLELLKGGKDRLVVRKTNTQILIQIIRYLPDGDKVILTSNSSDLRKHGWKYSFKNLPAAYLAGMLVAKKAKEHKISAVVLDLGLQTPLHGSKLFATLKGAVDGGLKIPANEKAFPKDERVSGNHVSKYLDKYKNIQMDFKKLKEELSK